MKTNQCIMGKACFSPAYNHFYDGGGGDGDGDKGNSGDNGHRGNPTPEEGAPEPSYEQDDYSENNSD